MNRSENINEFAAALVRAQSQMNGAKRTSDNPYYKSKYADLAEVWDTCRKPLSDNGLAVIQGDGTQIADKICVQTLVVHTSGQWISLEFSASPMRNEKGKPPIVSFDSQSVAACITYLRRYGLMSAIGIAPEDDDAESITGRDDPELPEPQKIELSPEQLDIIDKVRIIIEENQDGKTVNKDRLKMYMAESARRTGKPIPSVDTEEDKDGKKINIPAKIAAFVMGRPDVMKTLLTEAK